MTNRTHVLVLALRVLFAFLVASASGVGGFFLLLGLLPEFAMRAQPGQNPYAMQHGPLAGPSNPNDPWAHIDYIESPATQASKRRFATCFGGAFLAGSVCMVALFLASKRWFPPYPNDPDYGTLPIPSPSHP